MWKGCRRRPVIGGGGTGAESFGQTYTHRCVCDITLAAAHLIGARDELSPCLRRLHGVIFFLSCDRHLCAQERIKELIYRGLFENKSSSLGVRSPINFTRPQNSRVRTKKQSSEKKKYSIPRTHNIFIESTHRTFR